MEGCGGRRAGRTCRLSLAHKLMMCCAQSRSSELGRACSHAGAGWAAPDSSAPPLVLGMSEGGAGWISLPGSPKWRATSCATASMGGGLGWCCPAKRFQSSSSSCIDVLSGMSLRKGRALR